MYDMYSDVPEEESGILWAGIIYEEHSGWQGDQDPLLIALCD